MSKEKKIHIVKSVIKHGLLLCVGFFWIYPFLWMISASFKGQNEFFQNRMGFRYSRQSTILFVSGRKRILALILSIQLL